MSKVFTFIMFLIVFVKSQEVILKNILLGLMSLCFLYGLYVLFVVFY